MDKTAIAAKGILKTLARYGLPSAAIAGAGAGVLGHRIGVKSGATRTADAMAGAFADANARENSQIVNAFRLANAKENRLLASAYLKKGYQLGMRRGIQDGTGPYGRGLGPGQGRGDGTGLGQLSTAGIPAVKTAEDIQTVAFADEMAKLGYDTEELEKLGFSVGALASLGKRAIGAIGRSTIGKSFKNLIGAGRHAVKAGQQARAGGFVNRLGAQYHAGAAKGLLGKSKGALATVGGVGAFGLGRASKRQKAVTYYK